MENREQVARLIGVAAAAALAAACVLVLRPFLSALLWSAILVFTTWPGYRVLTGRLRMGRDLAAGIMVLAAFLVLVVPLGLAAPASREDVEAIRAWIERAVAGGLPDLSPLFGQLPLVGAQLAEWWTGLAGDTSMLVAALRPHAGTIAQALLALLLSVLSGLAEMLLAIALAFFLYRDGPALAEHSYRLLETLAGAQAGHLWKLTGDVTRGVVYGLLGTALAQGFLTAFGLWIAGVPEPVLLGVVAGAISILPVGAPLVWGPAAIWLFATGSLGWGLFMLLYGGLVISSTDNVIRPWLISRGADLPILLTLLGALGGVLAFGFLGLFLGPVVLALGYALLRDWAGAGRDPASPGAAPPV